MIAAAPDITTTLFTLPPDAKFLPVSELSPRLRARIGVVSDGQAVITRPGYRVTTRLVPRPLADLLSEFHTPSRLTDAVLRFARAHDQDPFATLDLAFDALATLVEARILVPDGSPDAIAPAPSLAAGQEFAGFEIESLVRSLEDSEVYRAHAAGGEIAALKIARDDRIGVAAILANEASTLERLGGSDTPRLLVDGTRHVRPYVAMEWCDGVSIAIAAQQARAARDRRRLHALVVQMLDVYGRLHRRGVLHGDVHPGNCLLREDGRVVLVDFGNAVPIAPGRAVDPARAGIAQFHDPQMAEALLAGRLPPAATPASEQYAVCVLAYLLLTGLQPIDAPAIHDELLRGIVERVPLPFAARGVESWPEVEAVLQRGLAKSPEHRFPDVVSVSRAFAAAGAARSIEPVPRAAQRAFDAAVERARSVVASADPLHDAWFAFRAALVLEDAELLGAADILVRRAGSGWAAQSVAALVARARSDFRAEGAAMAAFLASAEQVTEPFTIGCAIAAAAVVVDGAVSRSAPAAALASWAGARLNGLVSHVPAAGEPRVDDALLVYGTLLLAKAGAITPPADLTTRLERLAETHRHNVWLWALAYDVLAEERFRQAALAAPLPETAFERGRALLRLYQLSGNAEMLAAATATLADGPDDRFAADDLALLVVEVKAAESAMLPPFDPPLHAPHHHVRS